MQTIMHTRTSCLRSNQAVCDAGQLSAPDSAGAASSTGIATLAPAFGQALPSLADVRAEYSHEVNAELVYELCAALVAPQTPRRRTRLATCAAASGSLFPS